MPEGLHRFQQSKQTHFVTFSCLHRQPRLVTPELCNRILATLERARIRFGFQVYAYVLMPEHVHLMLSEPSVKLLADAIHFLKLSSSKNARKLEPGGWDGGLWEKRYYDRNIRSYADFVEKMRYIHRNPVKRGLCAAPEDWAWSSYRHYATGEFGAVEIESEWTAQGRDGRIPG